MLSTHVVKSIGVLATQRGTHLCSQLAFETTSITRALPSEPAIRDPVKQPVILAPKSNTKFCDGAS